MHSANKSLLSAHLMNPTFFDFEEKKCSSVSVQVTCLLKEGSLKVVMQMIYKQHVCTHCTHCTKAWPVTVLAWHSLAGLTDGSEQFSVLEGGTRHTDSELFGNLNYLKRKLSLYDALNPQ